MNKRGYVLRQLEVSAERAKKLLKDSWPFILSSISIVLYMRIDQIMLGQMVNDETVGVYSAAIRVSEVWYFIPMAVTMSLRPLILKARANHQSTRYLDLIKGLSALLFFLSILIGICFSVFSQEIILFLFGPPYLEASSVLTLHIWTGVFVVFGLARGVWILGENLQRYDLIFIAGGAVINVIGNVILIPSLGMLGAAIATILAQAFVGLISPVLITKTRRSFFLLLESCNIFKWIELARLLKT
jgi:PST family polysaccharide transporter